MIIYCKIQWGEFSCAVLLGVAGKSDAGWLCGPRNPYQSNRGVALEFEKTMESIVKKIQGGNFSSAHRCYTFGYGGFGHACGCGRQAP